jgi:glycosyltransferase involved in cell wall biosynthesis
MKKLNEVTVFTNGDSSKLSTWSNVPFFLTNTFISKGIKVNRIDISGSPFLQKIYYKTFYKVFKMLNKGTAYDYYHSNIHFYNARNRIKSAVKQYPNSDADIFLTFTFSSAGLQKKTIVQLCDWTYDHYFKYFLGREPDIVERQSIKREDSQIEGSDLVFSLFPNVADYMKQRYKNENINYIGNVINSLYEVSETDLDIKANSNNLLFIGGKKYIEGAKALIAAFKSLINNHKDLVLHIIGIEATEFEDLPKNVFCYGYLDKGKDQDRELYYKLLKEAKVFINTTPKWGAFSASIEALYFYTPVILTPYDEFLNIYGKEIDFGFYCEENSAVLIEQKILKILNDKSYRDLCINAHNAVKEFTWDAYVDKIIKKIEEKSKCL